VEVEGAAIRIDDRSGVGEARRHALTLTTALNLDAQSQGRVSLVVTELATNVHKHGRRGWCLMSPSPHTAGVIDVVVTDEGDGIEDVRRAFSDGYSTYGSPGNGLGAVRRQSIAFEIFTQVGHGTTIYAGIGPDPARLMSSPPQVQQAAFTMPFPGESVCGDAWAARNQGGTTRLVLADGLGHGPDAAQASRAATSVLHRYRPSTPVALLEHIHRELHGTRGAAVATAWLDPATGRVTFAGLGNISGTIVSSEGSRSMASGNGTAGHRSGTIREYEYEAPPGSSIILHSDGVATRWDLAAYPGLQMRAPAVIAGVLMRDFLRGRDDASVIVARMPTAPAVS
jgi:anti-sigma regulatory factor (Ser/Thr protein kinase)